MCFKGCHPQLFQLCARPGRAGAQAHPPLCLRKHFCLCMGLAGRLACLAHVGAHNIASTWVLARERLCTGSQGLAIMCSVVSSHLHAASCRVLALFRYTLDMREIDVLGSPS